MNTCPDSPDEWAPPPSVRTTNACHWFARRPFVYDMPPLLQPSLPAPYTTPLDTRRNSAPILNFDVIVSEHRRLSLPCFSTSPTLYLEGLPKYLDPFLKDYFDACQTWSERVAVIHGPSDYFLRRSWVITYRPPGPSDIARDLGLCEKWVVLNDALQHEHRLAHERDDTDALRFIEEVVAEMEVDLMTILDSCCSCGLKCCNMGDCPSIYLPNEATSDRPDVPYLTSTSELGELDVSVGFIPLEASKQITAKEPESKKSGKQVVKLEETQQVDDMHGYLNPEKEMTSAMIHDDKTGSVNKDEADSDDHSTPRAINSGNARSVHHDKAKSDQDRLREATKIDKARSTNNDIARSEPEPTFVQDQNGEAHNLDNKLNSRNSKKKKKRSRKDSTSIDEYLDGLMEENKVQREALDLKMSSESPKAHGMSPQVPTLARNPAASNTSQAREDRHDSSKLAFIESTNLTEEQKCVRYTAMCKKAIELGASNPDGIPTLDQVNEMLDNWGPLIPDAKLSQV
jgi:hypothetical protein